MRIFASFNFNPMFYLLKTILFLFPCLTIPPPPQSESWDFRESNYITATFLLYCILCAFLLFVNYKLWYSSYLWDFFDLDHFAVITRPWYCQNPLKQNGAPETATLLHSPLALVLPRYDSNDPNNNDQRGSLCRRRYAFHSIALTRCCGPKLVI